MLYHCKPLILLHCIIKCNGDKQQVGKFLPLPSLSATCPPPHCLDGMQTTNNKRVKNPLLSLLCTSFILLHCICYNSIALQMQQNIRNKVVVKTSALPSLSTSFPPPSHFKTKQSCGHPCLPLACFLTVLNASNKQQVSKKHAVVIIVHLFLLYCSW